MVGLFKREKKEPLKLWLFFSKRVQAQGLLFVNTKVRERRTKFFK